jgi:hypothetical protein
MPLFPPCLAGAPAQERPRVSGSQAAVGASLAARAVRRRASASGALDPEALPAVSGRRARPGAHAGVACAGAVGQPSTGRRMRRLRCFCGSCRRLPPRALRPVPARALPRLLHAQVQLAQQRPAVRQRYRAAPPPSAQRLPAVHGRRARPGNQSNQVQSREASESSLAGSTSCRWHVKKESAAFCRFFEKFHAQHRVAMADGQG